MGFNSAFKGLNSNKWAKDVTEETHLFVLFTTTMHKRQTPKYNNEHTTKSVVIIPVGTETVVL